MRRLALLSVLVLLAPAGAGGQDPGAPPGASERWLPCERWVMLHWLPYDERRLFRILRITRREAEVWMRDDEHHTFAQLGRRRGLPTAVLAARLVTPWSTHVPAQHLEMLHERAVRTLTNGHLAQHVFFHVFHHPGVGARARDVYGVSALHYLELRRAGYSPAEIGAIGGRSRAATRRAIARSWRASARRGVRRGETTRSQATRFVRHQLDRMEDYLDYRLIPKQPGLLPGPPGQADPHPQLRLLCTLFAGHWRAAQPENYGHHP